MKTGKTLTQLAQEIERRANAKSDLVASTQHMNVRATGDGVKIAVGDEYEFAVNSVAHDQIGTHTGIPAVYYDKMLTEAPALLANNVNEWFHKYPATRMVRVLDDTNRAFLSDKFCPDMENEDLAAAVLPVIGDLGLDVMSCDVTDRRLYIKAVDKKVTRELAKHGARFGDGGHTIVRIVSPSITISNSEVGLGALSIQGGTYDAFCSNLASFGERSMRRAHVGQKHSIEEGALYAMLSDKTRRLDQAALWSKVRDVVRGVFDQVKFDALVNKIEGTRQEHIVSEDVVKVVKVATVKLGLNETEGKSVLKHLIEGGELSRFGLYNAVTRMSADVESYDRATELERVGAKVIELPKNEWKEIAEAA
jgi:hypothetical protein